MPIRLLLVGDTGTAKTSALLSLIRAGYKVNLADFDNGTDYLRAELDSSVRANLSIKVFTDHINRIGGQTSVLQTPTAINRLGKALDSWDDQGPITKWSTNTVFVLDSLTFCARAFAKQHMSLNNLNLEAPLEARQFGPIQGLILNFLDRLHDDQLKCHYILITHLDYREYREDTFSPVGMMEKSAPGRPEAGKVSPNEIDIKGVPTVFGAKLGPQVGRYFNFMIQAKTKIVGQQVKFVLQLQPDTLTNLKCPIKSLGAALPLDSGLATIFKKWEELKMDQD